MKAYGGVDVYIHIFLTSALAGGEWLASCPGRFTTWEAASGTHWIGGWVDPQSRSGRRGETDPLLLACFHIISVRKSRMDLNMERRRDIVNRSQNRSVIDIFISEILPERRAKGI
jgi:hypothetical protein